jgi:hypothetical protein
MNAWRQLLRPNAPDIEELGQRIRDRHQQVLTRRRDNVTDAILIGHDILELKRQLRWGEIGKDGGKWLRENCGLHPRNADRYAYLAEHEAILTAELAKLPNSDSVSELTLASAKRLIDKARIASGDLKPVERTTRTNNDEPPKSVELGAVPPPAPSSPGLSELLVGAGADEVAQAIEDAKWEQERISVLAFTLMGRVEGMKQLVSETAQEPQLPGVDWAQQ